MKIKCKEYLSFYGRDFILACICCFTSVNATASESTKFEFSRNSQNLILSFSETHGIMRGLDSKTTLKVYGNGLVKVHFPPYMKKAGNYQMMLDEKELDALLQSLADQKIPELDINNIDSEKLTASEQASLNDGPDLFAVFDASVTTIEINLDRYTKLPDPQTSGNTSLVDSSYDIVDLQKKISWEGLRIDSKRFPNIQPLQNLATAHKILLDMTVSDQLVRNEN